MVTVGLYEAKTKLSELLDRVEGGEELVITRHGVPVARLVPAAHVSRRDIAGAISEWRRLRTDTQLNPPGADHVTVRDLINYGRK
ncbi:type II toxin-antitoxin system Phd/YefM family antitoxin [Gemmata obscuriglobus]|uniref:Antitoxin n=1 Tax=Gemmata obscuriglobus TaxID=114 RepID=A0A2Z3H8E7_9BACT|nr:type II toxin-antitoxin system prevent-host-death family antitoxin [Gemmata obscuriglobus]AWM42323.1 type II toxin-antitoxin system Phd/YefM family antitoxin [Gemmata obscuriglobus]